MSSVLWFCHFSLKNALLLEKGLIVPFLDQESALFPEKAFYGGEQKCLFVLEMPLVSWIKPLFCEKCPFVWKSVNLCVF